MINSDSYLKGAVDPEVPGSSDGRDVCGTGRLDGEVLNSVSIGSSKLQAAALLKDRLSMSVVSAI